MARSGHEIEPLIYLFIWLAGLASSSGTTGRSPGIQHKLVHLIQHVILLTVFRNVESIVLVVDSGSISDHRTCSFRGKPVCPDQGVDGTPVGIDPFGSDPDLAALVLHAGRELVDSDPSVGAGENILIKPPVFFLNRFRSGQDQQISAEAGRGSDSPRLRPGGEGSAGSAPAYAGRDRDGKAEGKADRRCSGEEAHDKEERSLQAGDPEALKGF